MWSDPCSDILRFTAAQSLVTGGFSAGGDWALQFPVPRTIKFFAVVKGGCWVSIEGESQPFRFHAGDVGLLSAKRRFVLASDLTLTPRDAMTVFSDTGKRPVRLGDGEGFTHIGGHVLLDPASGQWLADVLPPWIHVPATSAQAATFRWLLDQLVLEQSSVLPGASLASAQLAQLLFIQVLRAHLSTAAPMPASWLRALGDARLAPALRLMHAEPGRAWTLSQLAAACAMSRTTFAARFRAVAGVTPLGYLTQWRMRLAERALREENVPLARLAARLGYASESALSHAFKRVTGKSPRASRPRATSGPIPTDD